MLLLGAVQEIRVYEVMVSLPSNMRGSVAITDVSDVVTRLVESELDGKEREGEEKEEEGEEEVRKKIAYTVHV